MNLYEELTEYGHKDIYPYHMPGHKRKEQSFLPEKTALIDLTEVQGTDNLHAPTGILKDAQEYCAEVTGADHSYFLINGSTAGVISAIFAAVSEGGKLIIVRNAHKSAYHGMALRNAIPAYIYPETEKKWGFCKAVTPDEIGKAMEENPDAEAVFIVSPTYEGCLCKVEEIAKIAHLRGIPLIVDEAHGAHLPYLGGKYSACRAGADIVIQSTHKTLPAPTQTALLHVNGSLVKKDRIERYLRVFQSSSPSYPLMAGIDGAVRLMAARGGELLETLENNYAGLVSKINNELKYISAYPFCKGINDAGKLLLSASDGNNIFMTGTELSEILRNEYGAETEMSSERSVLAMFTVSDDREAYNRLFDALTKIDETLRKKAENGCTGTVITEYDDIPRPKIALPPGSAWKTESEEIPVEESVGRISDEIVGLYPPGTPLLAMGEIIEREHVKLIKRYIGEKLEVSGIKDGMISVLKGEGLSKDI